jgi:predicted nucleotidyltransferase
MNKPDLREKDLETLRQTFLRFPSVHEVRLFGSRANGTARRASDIDLAIFAPDADTNEGSNLIEAIEEAPIIHEFDIVRPEKTGNARLLEKIEREGLRIYSISSVNRE